MARSLIFFFFFSSRRRHTRCGRDWSSDVCSSDLLPDFMEVRPLLIDMLRFMERKAPEATVREVAEVLGARLKNLRSEERRVGKECRSRWGPEQLKKKMTQRSVAMNTRRDSDRGVG